MSWIHTYTGKSFDLRDPRPDQVDLEDIAHALSMQCRYNGHARRFYSIAEHSVHVARELAASGITDPDVLRSGLLHDASEAYVGDLVAPIKLMSGFENFRALEHQIWRRAIAPRFGLPEQLASAVKLCDLRMLATEAPQVLPWPPPRPWDLPDHATPLPAELFFDGPERAKLRFLSVCAELGVR